MIASLFDNIIPTLGIILGFGFIIFVHELGHFLVAKAVGIKCTQFAIGFGQSLLTFRKGLGLRVGSTEEEYDTRLKTHALKTLGQTDDEDEDSEIPEAALEASRVALDLGETEYRLNWMPLGGYVKMLGQEDMDPSAQSADPRSFNRKPVWARACVVSAGVVMNLIFGLLFFVIAFLAGVDFPPAVVGATDPNGVAAATYPIEHPNDENYKGLQPGDKILSIDGDQVTDMMQVAIKVALANPEAQLNMAIQRDGVETPLHFVMKPKLSNRSQQLLSLGIEPPMSLEVFKPAKGDQLPDALTQAAVQVGMKVTAIDGQTISRFDQLMKSVKNSKGKEIHITFRDQAGNTAKLITQATPALSTQPDDAHMNLAGIVPATQINRVLKGSQADELGIQAGDIIANLGNIPWPTWEDILNTFSPDTATNASTFSADASLTLNVWREGKIIGMGSVQPSRGKLGVGREFVPNHVIVSRVLENSAFAPLNLIPGSIIKSVNEVPINNFGDLQIALQLLAQNPQSQSVEAFIGYELNIKGKPAFVNKVNFDQSSLEQLQKASWTLPLELAMVFGPQKIRIQADNPIEAIGLGITKTHQFMVQTYITLARLFQGSVKAKHLRGPIGILDEGRRIARQGWPYLMFFLGLISVNLVVINFLPIPIVDGGLMVFLIIEKIKGSPVSAKIQTAAMVLGLVLIAGIFLVTLYYDFSRLEFIQNMMNKLF
ncbi:site-2 protease family protein [bacterium AH-315-I18]|nr:site-2 protease family protein [Phycisphaeraceae bacterium]MBN4061034.1 site-2 protease family protein [bacterium AH-315-I18]